MHKAKKKKRSSYQLIMAGKIRSSSVLQVPAEEKVCKVCTVFFPCTSFTMLKEPMLSTFQGKPSIPLSQSYY